MTKRKNEAVVEVRHKFFKGDRVEVMGPDTTNFETTVNYIINENGEEVDEAPHPRELIRIPVTHKVKPYYLVRRKKS